MDVVLLGTAAPEGWPVPFCGCGSCAAVRALGPAAARSASAALVDGRLLLDAPADAVRSAPVPLTGVRHLLVTAPGRLSPDVLRWRSGAGAASPLSVVGTAAALARAAAALEPGDPVVLREVTPGDRLRVGAYEVRVVDLGSADDVGYDVAVAGERLLWAPGLTGRLPAAALERARDRAWSLVLAGPPAGLAPALDGLRGAGAVTRATRVVAVGLGHDDPPPPDLEARLAALGVEVHADGARPGPGPGRRVLVLGGARSGKSAYAERLVATAAEVLYVATAPPRPDDAEWQDRVALHRARRPAHWKTTETTEVAELLRDPPPGSRLLVDDVTLWLSAALDDAGVWAGRAGAEERYALRTDALVAAWAATTADVVAVTAEVGLGVVPSSAAGRRYRDELGRLNQRLAAAADEVWQVTAGLPLRLR